MVDGIVVWEIDRRSDSYGDYAGDEVLVALTDLGMHRRDSRSGGVLQIDDHMTQLGFRSQGHGRNTAGVG